MQEATRTSTDRPIRRLEAGTHVLVVHDEALYGDAVGAALARRGMTTRCVSAASDQEVKAALADGPDLVLVASDSRDEWAVELGEAIVRQGQNTKLVLLTNAIDPGHVAAAVRAGFRGVIRKDTDLRNLLIVIDTVLAGDAVVVDRPSTPARSTREPNRGAELLARHLTSREREVLALLVAGAKGATIARRLSISPHTVRTHIQGILQKLQVHSRIEAAAFAVRHGMVKPSSLSGSGTGTRLPHADGSDQRTHPSGTSRRGRNGHGGRIAVLVAHQASLLREGMKSAFADDPDVDVVAEAGDGVQLVAQVKRTRADVVVLGAELPGCEPRAIVGRLRMDGASPDVVVVSERDDVSVLAAMLEAGATGFFTTQSDLAAVLQGVKAVHSGDTIVPQKSLRGLIELLLQRRSGKEEAERRLATLSRQEQSVLRLLSEGANRKDIARALRISDETARTHLQNVRRKLGVHSRLEAAAFAMQPFTRDQLWQPEPVENGSYGEGISDVAP